MNFAENYQQYKNMVIKIDDKLPGFVKKCEEIYQSKIKKHYEELADEKKVPREKIPELMLDFPVINFHKFLKRAAWQIIFNFYGDYFVTATEEEMLFICDFLKDYVPDMHTFTQYFDKKNEHTLKHTDGLSNDVKNHDGGSFNNEADVTSDDSLIISDEADKYESILTRIEEEPDYILSKDIRDRLHRKDAEAGGYIGEPMLYHRIIHFAASLGFKGFNAEIKKAIIENAVCLREMKFIYVNGESLLEKEFLERGSGSEAPKVEGKTLRDSMYPTDFALEISEVLLYFFRWSYDENNVDKIKSLLEILRKYISENLLLEVDNFEEYHLEEMREKLLKGESIKSYQLRDAMSDLTNFDEFEIISEEGMSLYRYPYLFAVKLERWGTSMNDDPYTMQESSENCILSTMGQINENLHNLFIKYKKNLKMYDHLITDSEEHIYQEDCPLREYDGDEELEQRGYGIMSVQRDVMILQCRSMDTKWKENIVEDTRSRLITFFDYRVKKLYNMYIDSISASFRNCLYAFGMCRDLLEILLSNKHPIISSDLTQARELDIKIIENYQQIERAVYEWYNSDVKSTLKSISYEGITSLKELEARINFTVKEYQEEIKHVWENKSVEELCNNKIDILTGLRRRIPCLSEEIKEDTIKLYMTLLQRKSSDDGLMTDINKKYRSIWNLAEQKLERIYQEKGITRNARSMDEFVKPMFTAEYLYRNFGDDSMSKLLDYSSIALEYYASMEYFMNTFIYVPLRELYLTSSGQSNYRDFMNEATYELIHKRRSGYVSGIMYGNFGHLFDNIGNAQGLLQYFVSFRNKGKEENENDLKNNIKLLAEKLVKPWDDNITDRRNESAHGGKVLSIDRARAARAIIYDPGTAVDNVAERLIDSFNFLLNSLGIDE